jgi:hydrogenase expression/formation protein HypD
MTTEENLLAQRLIHNIHRNSTRAIRLMEFCGGHTVAILKYGIRQLLPNTIHMFSGPGCPVCVTSSGDIDNIIMLSRQPGVILATFGDLMRVPGNGFSLQQSRAEGNDVRIVYSTLEALDIARQCPKRQVIMIGIGFETTAPTIAASILQACREGVRNYKIISLNKMTPPVMQAILNAGEIHVDGIICPGHVSTIIGSEPYDFIPRNYGVSCVVTGFEPLDILLGVEMLVKQIESGQPKVEIAYRQAVRPEGNPKALELMERVFDITGANWRGIGLVESSGFKLKPQFEAFDAEKTFDLPRIVTPEPARCLCGSILRGVKKPSDCTLFETVCTPEYPIGPCMVSSEGACSAFHLYGGING